MRDLMVAKSAGKDSELLILTAEQRKQTSELSEKFDTAALVYNITTLEKMRWSIKNSDTPRALLEALLLRFALSEHFLNVDDLLARSKGNAPAPINDGPEASSISTERLSAEQRESSIEQKPPIKEVKTNSQKKNNILNDPAVKEQRESSIEQKPPIKEVKTNSQKKNNLLNDPAVKTVIIGLDATITRIEED
ncbi:MAG: hypothetical protein ACYSW7_09110 [Planctomycetota bacterium]|jgi:DNA polymerase III gamma/tau subunit